jgi:hypothetical protein
MYYWQPCIDQEVEVMVMMVTEVVVMNIIITTEV